MHTQACTCTLYSSQLSTHMPHTHRYPRPLIPSCFSHYQLPGPNRLERTTGWACYVTGHGNEPNLFSGHQIILSFQKRYTPHKSFCPLIKIIQTHTRTYRRHAPLLWVLWGLTLLERSTGWGPFGQYNLLAGGANEPNLLGVKYLLLSPDLFQKRSLPHPPK